MSRCDGCKHWGSDGEVASYSDGELWQVCALTDVDGKPKHKSLALAQGTEGVAVLRCSASFGCVQFEAK